MFLYFLFNPCNLALAEEYAEDILEIYRDTCWAANSYEFAEMYGHIVDYLADEYKSSLSRTQIDAIKKSFRFVLTDQTTYLNYISQ